MKKISIVIPAFNSEKTIERAVRSLLEQNPPPYELIVINDGSADGTSSILKNIAIHHTNLIIRDIVNSGPSEARNIGLRMASGDLVAFADADDYVESGFIKKAIEIYEIHNCDVICFAHLSKSKGKIKTIKRISNSLALSGPNEAIRYFLLGFIEKSPCTKVFNRNFLRKNDIYFPTDISLSEDAVFAAKALSLSREVYLCDDAYYVYEQDNESITRSKFTTRKLNSLFGAIVAIEKITSPSSSGDLLCIFSFKQTLPAIYSATDCELFFYPDLNRVIDNFRDSKLPKSIGIKISLYKYIIQATDNKTAISLIRALHKAFSLFKNIYIGRNQ